MSLATLKYDTGHISEVWTLLAQAKPRFAAYAFADHLIAGFLTMSRLHHLQGNTAMALASLDEGVALADQRNLVRVRYALQAERIRLLIEEGQVADAQQCAKEMAVDLSQPAPLPRSGTTTRDESRALSWVRIAAATGCMEEALLVVRSWRKFCRAREAIRCELQWEILFARLQWSIGNQRLARRSLRTAIRLAAPGRLTRCFQDEGPEIRALLHELVSSDTNSRVPVKTQIVQLLKAPQPPQTTDAGHEFASLSPRQKQLVVMLAADLSNLEIAEKLEITESAVKSSLQQVFLKLGVRRRLQVVERARRAGLVA